MTEQKVKHGQLRGAKGVLTEANVCHQPKPPARWKWDPMQARKNRDGKGCDFHLSIRLWYQHEGQRLIISEVRKQ